MEISTERLRQAIINYYTVALSYNIVEAQDDIDRAVSASQEELLEMAEDCDIDVKHFEINSYSKQKLSEENE